MKNQAQQDRQAILEEDGGKTLSVLGVDCNKKKQPRHRIWIAGAAGMAVSLAVVLVCVFTIDPPASQPEKFLEENFATETSTVEQMNTELHDFFLTIDEDAFQIYITRTYDSVSQEALFYQLSINRYDNSLHGEFYITCNENYHYSDFTFSKTPIVENLPNYSVTYQLESTMKFGLEQINCKAQIEGNTDHIYITKYDELLLDPDHTFLDSVQTLIHPTEK